MKVIIFNGTLVVFSCYFLYLTTTFPYPKRLEGELYADFWPKVVLVGLLLNSLFLLILSIAEKIKTYRGFLSENNVKSLNEKKTNFHKLVLVMLMTALYVYLLKIFGFAVLTLIFLFFFLYIMGLRKRILIIILPFAITVCTILVFTGVMRVVLPRGIGIFRQISILLY